MSRRSAEQIMRENAVPSYADQQTLVRSLNRAAGQVDWVEKLLREGTVERTPERLAALEKNRTKMTTLTAYLRRYGRAWEQRQ